jgi:hypothetical protein
MHIRLILFEIVVKQVRLLGLKITAENTRIII